jgi:hypothetical protein
VFRPRLENAPPWTLGIVAAIGALVVGITGYQWWNIRGLVKQAREQATPACEQQLGADACREHLARYHDDCARLTTKRPTRLSRGPTRIDADSYLRCVVLGVDEWVAENGRRHEEEERASRRQQYQLP